MSTEPVKKAEPSTFKLNFANEEEREDYLDYCTAVEAIDEALETGGIRSFEEFAKKVGL